MEKQLNNHGEEHVLEYDQITDYIYIGTNMCCQVTFEDELLQKGIEVDMSLEEERLDAPFGVKYFVWLPVADRTPPTQGQLEFGASSIAQFVEMEKKMYIHCMNGHGRAPTMVAAYLITTGKSVDEAIHLILEKRPSIHLEESQVDALKQFASEHI